jgi:heme O synthase-like polyprenyltransferase
MSSTVLNMMRTRKRKGLLIGTFDRPLLASKIQKKMTHRFACCREISSFSFYLLPHEKTAEVRDGGLH